MHPRAYRVLAVSNDRKLLRRLSRFLDVFDYETVTAATADQALELLEGEPFDFLVVDGDAEQALTISRRTETSRGQLGAAGGPYTLLCLARPAVSQMLEALEAGVDDVLAKPLVFGELLARLRAGSRTLEYARRQALQAGREALTQLPGRASFHRELCRRFTHRHQEPFACVLGDLDQLGTINHRLGRLAGDDWIRAAARRIHDACQQGEFLAWLGGGRFAVLLPGTHVSQAVSWAEQLRGDLQQTEFQLGDHDLRITASLAVIATSRRDLHHTDPADLMADLEETLSEVKRSGRNHVISADELGSETQEWAQQASEGQLFRSTIARDVMLPCLDAFQETDALSHAARIMARTGQRIVPVIDHQRQLVGILELEPDEAGRLVDSRGTLAEYVTRRPLVLEEETPFDDLLQAFAETDSPVAVIARQGLPTGLVLCDTLLSLSKPHTPADLAPLQPFTPDSSFLLVHAS